jgi:glycosyltransferase involved in cell wall biosynthesis
MVSKLPLVSIVTPSFNYGHFIEDTILSVKNQDYPNIEHIVVDGGSSDNTLRILKKYDGQYNLRWISESDRGQSDAVNKGFRMAKGQIIGWLNADDVYFAKDAFSYIVRLFKANPMIGVIYGDNACINENNLVLKVRHLPNFNYNRLHRIDYISEPSTFIRKSVIEKHELDVNIDLPMDYEYWLRLVHSNIKFKHVGKIISAERIQPAMKTRSRWEEMKRETRKVQKMYGQDLGNKFNALKVSDSLLMALLKVYSIKLLVQVYSSGSGSIPFPTRFDSLPKSVWRQSFYI